MFEVRNQLSLPHHFGFLVGLLFDHEDEGYMLLWNIGL
jgi:hypothetical protein